MKRTTVIRFLWQWHRRFGLIACLILLILAITGVLLNHSSKLGWDRTPIDFDWILSSYGFNAPQHYRSIEISGHYWVLFGDQVFYDDQVVSRCSAPWHSLLSKEELVVAACRSQVTLFDADGTLLETVHALPKPDLKSVGSVVGERGLLLDYSDQQYLMDLDSLEITTTSDQILIPHKSVTIPDELHASLRSAFIVEDLTWERFLLDIHAGRWFGGWGWIIMDLGALILISLSLSGVAMYVLRLTR